MKRLIYIYSEMIKMTQLADFEDQNLYKTVIFKIKIEIITYYEFFKSNSIENQMFYKLFLKSLLNYEFFNIHKNFI